MVELYYNPASALVCLSKSVDDKPAPGFIILYTFELHLSGIERSDILQ